MSSTSINSSLIGDDDLKIISQLNHITSLNLNGSKHVTDKGLTHLARMTQLRELILDGEITDRGLEVLAQLRELRVFKMFWQSNVTDRGIANLKLCDQLEEVDLLGCNAGDDAIVALRPQCSQAASESEMAERASTYCGDDARCYLVRFFDVCRSS